MDLTFTPEQDAFRTEARAWLEANVPKAPLPSFDTAEGWDAHRAWERDLADAGWAVVNCNCNLVCPCGVDGPPTSKDGQCYGSQVLHITEGSKDGVDLSGIDVGWVYHIPGNVTGGNWKMAIAVDPGVSDDRVQALEQIFKGEDGGPFGDFAPLIGSFLETQRVPVAFTSGKEPKGTIGSSTLAFMPLVGQDGNPTTIKNAMLGFAPEYEIGKGSGSTDVAGITFDAIYGEHAQFEFAS